MSKTLMTVTVIERFNNQKDDVVTRTYENVSGAKVDAQSGITTVVDSYGQPIAVFVLTPQIYIEMKPSAILQPELALKH